MKLGYWSVCQKLHIYSLSTPGGQNWAYFCSMGSGFRDMDRFSKLPYVGMKLGHLPKFQRLHIYPLSTLGGRNRAYLRSTGLRFPIHGPIFKNAIFGPESWPLAKVPEIVYILPQLTPTPPQSQISPDFALRLAISKVLGILHFLIVTGNR